MPAGVSWGKYILVSATAYLFMFAGAQVVHSVYRPLDDLDILVKNEVERLKKLKSQSGNNVK